MLKPEVETAQPDAATAGAGVLTRASRRGDAAGDARWIRALISAHFDFVWRSLRRLGVPEADTDDAAQKVFLVALRRSSDIVQGSERAFLFGVAQNIASDVRRTLGRTREVPSEREIDLAAHPGLGPEEILDRKHARQTLDEVLDALDVDLRAVFVLSELEELTAPEVASLLNLPPGTVASRLRRARDQFGAIVKRLRTSRAYDEVNKIRHGGEE